MGSAIEVVRVGPDEVFRIPLTKGQFAIVDRCDAGVLEFDWYALRGQKTWYAARRSGGEDTLLHRAILGAPDGVEVDHLNGDGLNCRRGNLRLASHTQNQMNRGPQANNTSGFKGVVWDRARERWRAQIRHGGRNLMLGRFESAEEAARAYDSAALRFFGEFAWLNLPALPEVHP